MNSIEVVKIGLKELDELVPLMDSYRVFYDRLSSPDEARKFLVERISKDEAVIFLAYKGDEAVGFTLLYTSFSSVSLAPLYILNDLFVDSEYRNLGIGEALLSKAQSFCIDNGYKGLALETAVDNPAQKLYERMGWKRDSHCFHYFWSP